MLSEIGMRDEGILDDKNFQISLNRPLGSPQFQWEKSDQGRIRKAAAGINSAGGPENKCLNEAT